MEWISDKMKKIVFLITVTSFIITFITPIQVYSEQQVEQTKQAKEEIYKCPNCGNIVDEESKYCGYCGAKLQRPGKLKLTLPKISALKLPKLKLPKVNLTKLTKIKLPKITLPEIKLTKTGQFFAGVVFLLAGVTGAVHGFKDNSKTGINTDWQYQYISIDDTNYNFYTYGKIKNTGNVDLEIKKIKVYYYDENNNVISYDDVNIDKQISSNDSLIWSIDKKMYDSTKEPANVKVDIEYNFLKSYLPNNVTIGILGVGSSILGYYLINMSLQKNSSELTKNTELKVVYGSNNIKVSYTWKF